jgi:hypothetical protein
MPKATQTQQPDGFSAPEKAAAEQRELLQTGTPEPENQGKPQETKVHKLSHNAELYTPKERERKTPALLTVEQYLWKAKQDKAIADLVRSLRKTKVMTFEEWERETAALLKKKTW